MKIAYIILAHKLPHQLVRLVNRLHSEDTSFFLHIDKKTDDAIYQYLIKALKKLPNVHFIKRNKCYWSQFGHVQATLEGLKTIFTDNEHYNYFILLTGQCYPLKSNQEIKAYLSKQPELSYINYFPIPDPIDRNWEDRIFLWHFFWGRYHFKFPRINMFETPILRKLWNPIARNISNKRRIPGGLTPFHGWSYWCLNWQAIDYIYKFVLSNKSYMKFFKYVMFPDEIFFQTILLNSPLRNNLVNDDLRYINFPKGKSHPTILTKHNLSDYWDSANLFARKFDNSVDAEVLDILDQLTD